ncbi:MAG TPA: cupin domain-containing protein [Candidatus Binatia bacterium]
MAQHKHVVRLADVALDDLKGPEGSPFGGKRQRVGAAVGAAKLGYSVFTVPPGKAAFPFHAHHANEEMIYIFEGEGTLRIGADATPVAAGMFIAFPPGDATPHQLVNTGARELKYLCVSTMEYPDITEYPDGKKIGALTCPPGGGTFRAFYRKADDVPYYEGEDGGAVERVAGKK